MPDPNLPPQTEVAEDSAIASAAQAVVGNVVERPDGQNTTVAANEIMDQPVSGPGVTTVAEYVANGAPQGDFETARAEYTAATQPGQMVGARHEAVSVLPPSGGPTPPQA